MLAAAILALGPSVPPALAQSQPQTQIITGTGVAMTGDLITVAGSSIRLYGIAAPMPGETCSTLLGKIYDCYRRSTEILQVLIGNHPVSCTVTGTDHSGQKIGVCRSQNTELAAAIVARGWAFAYRRLTPVYVGAEAFAESHRLGLWAGKVETPWQWRSRQLSDTAR